MQFNMPADQVHLSLSLTKPEVSLNFCTKLHHLFHIVELELAGGKVQIVFLTLIPGRFSLVQYSISHYHMGYLPQVRLKSKA